MQPCKMLLDECEETGRIVVFAGFTGSVDRVVKLVKRERWSVVRCDQGNFQVLPHDDSPVTEEPLDYWANLEANPRVAFVANPEVRRHVPDPRGVPHGGLLVQFL